VELENDKRPPLAAEALAEKNGTPSSTRMAPATAAMTGERRTGATAPTRSTRRFGKEVDVILKPDILYIAKYASS
jgi:hypothetical protein